ncbi:winged helix-turn-helix transcriptional regulator [Streptomyces sp. M19]
MRPPRRFNELRQHLPTVTPKSLTACLRRLERNGVVERVVLSTDPVAIEYRISRLGRTLQSPAEPAGMGGRSPRHGRGRPLPLRRATRARLTPSYTPGGTASYAPRGLPRTHRASYAPGWGGTENRSPSAEDTGRLAGHGRRAVLRSPPRRAVRPLLPLGRTRDFTFYLPLVMSARSVLDVGCGTGALLRGARENGHTGRLCGLDPAVGMLEVARTRRTSSGSSAISPRHRAGTVRSTWR